MTKFGVTPDGQTVERIELTNGTLTVGLLTLGAILQSVRLDGIDHDLTLGSDTLDDYFNGMEYFGAIVGPIANRIANAKTQLNGTELSFEANQDGLHSLHSGTDGIHAHVWTIEDITETSAKLSLKLPDGFGGFPGDRSLEAQFTLDGSDLELQLTATSTADTLMNLANHSYWNLDGGATFDGQTLRVSADHFLPINDESLPTGEIKAVDNLAYDLRTGVALSPETLPLDHNFCLTDTRRSVTDVAVLRGTNGLAMTVATTEPGLQVYDGRTTQASNERYAPYAGLALEAQCWPNAMNEDKFPSVVLNAGQTYEQITRWKFSKP